ncbi:MAG: flagellar hook protein FlgE [Gammaproteobacteria bacterium]
MGIGNIAVSGMQAAMSNMDLISNNIANSQTAGFKRSYANFSDLFPSGNGAGGAQIGSGVLLSSITQDFSSGSGMTRSGLSLMIGESGFFTVKDNNSGLISYTRNGAFGVDNNGYLVTEDGTRRVQGYQATNGTVVTGGSVTDIQASASSFPPNASTFLKYSKNLDSSSTIPTNPFSPTDTTSYNSQTSGLVYDTLGGEHTVQSYYVKTAPNAWTAYSYVDGVAALSGGTNNLTFSSGGQLTSAATLAITFAPGTGAGSPQALNLNIGSMTQYGGKGQDKTSPETDGYQAGILQTVTVDEQGNLTQNFSNGKSTIAGQIAVANFQAESNLQNIGNASWTPTSTSGAALYSAASKLTSGQVEGSNVELTRELVDLINAQNAFQANAQSEKTFSEVMQTVTQL